MIHEFPDVLQNIILDYLEPEVKILELEKIGRLTFPESDPDLELRSRLEVSEDLAESIFCRDWELLVKTGTGEDLEETLYICRFNKFYTDKKEDAGKISNIRTSYLEMLDELFLNIDEELKDKVCENSCDLGENIYIYTRDPVDLYRYVIGDIHIDFYCEKCGKDYFNNNILRTMNIANKNFHILEPDTVMPNAYIGLQVIYIKNKKNRYGTSKSFIIYKNRMETSGFIKLDEEEDFEPINIYHRWIDYQLPEL